MPQTIISLDQVIVPKNRQRTEFPEAYIAELMQAIFNPEGAGLINPITLREGTTLVAGECRTKAVALGYKLGKKLRHAGEEVPAGHIPYIDFGLLTPLQQMEAEYSENAIRADLHYLDKAKAIAALHGLRQKQKDARLVDNNTRITSGTPERLTKQTFQETSTEIFKSPSQADTVAKSVQLVEMVKKNPELAKASSFKEAKKLMEKIITNQQNEKLAAVVGKVHATDKMRVFHEDCLGWMAKQPEGQYDVILTDPPYGMDADSFGDAAGRLSNAGHGHHYRDDADGTMALLARAIPEFFRLAKPEAHLYLWCDIELFFWLRDVCREAGWQVFRTPLVNVKPEGGRVPWANPPMGPRRAYELCLYAVKGKRPVTQIKSDVFESRLVEGNFGHGAQKPVQAYVELLSRSVRPGDRVLDAFAGTGTIFPAAHALNCYADGVEMEAVAYGICLSRIKELK